MFKGKPVDPVKIGSIRFKTGILAIIPLIFSPSLAYGQEATTTGSADFFSENMENIIIGLLVFILLIFILGMWVIGDRLIKISSHKLSNKSGESEEETEDRYSIYPTFMPPAKKKTRHVIELKKGFDISILGPAAKKATLNYHPSAYALKPTDFKAMSPIPKVMPEIGQNVKAGDPVYFDKKRPEIMHTAPVSGELAEIRRGAKRAITEVVIIPDREVQFRDFGSLNPLDATRQQIVERMLESGTWPFIVQRPYGIIADPNDNPKMIYISCFDTAPLAPDYDFMIVGHRAEFQMGLEVLKKLTDNDIHLGLNGKKHHNRAFTEAEGVKRHYFSGPHPAGNPGVQIHHIDPINKNDIVWVVNPMDVMVLGRLFLEGKYDTKRLCAVSGPEVKDPHYFETYTGASIEGMMKDNLLNDHVRYISGNVLTGTAVQLTGFVGFYDHLVSVIEEGDFYEPFGWLLPSYPRPSKSPTFISSIYAGEPLKVNTNTHGEERAFVVTGLYEDVLPMDIYPMQLCKAILVEDFEQIEGLGIYEVAEEDFALCEFVCPSKVEMMQIVRDGLELMRTQG